MQHHNCSTTWSNRMSTFRIRVYVAFCYYNFRPISRISLIFQYSSIFTTVLWGHWAGNSVFLDIFIYMFDTFIYKQHTRLLGSCPQWMSISPVGSPLIACCYTCLFLFLIFCLMQAISESVHVSWDTQLEQNRTRRICRTPRARRNKKFWDTPLFLRNWRPALPDLCAVCTYTLTDDSLQA